MATRITSIDKFEELLTEKKHSGRVFEVSRDVFEHYARKLFIRNVSSGERKEIGRLIGVSIPPSSHMGLTRTFKCTHCSHEFSFADHYRAALEMKIHTAEELAKFTVGDQDGHFYLAIDTDKTRDVKCVSCGETTIAPHCCYAGSSYAYA